MQNDNAHNSLNVCDSQIMKVRFNIIVLVSKFTLHLTSQIRPGGDMYHNKQVISEN